MILIDVVMAGYSLSPHDTRLTTINRFTTSLISRAF